jgi:murein DD-endopeptidase MepM/ murein hydrolase activator NlpD
VAPSPRMLALGSAAVLAALLLAGCGWMAVPPSRSQGAGATATTAAPPTAAGAPGSAVVQPGDTIYSVARRYNSPTRAIIDANHLEPPYVLRPGEQLIVPHPQVHLVTPGETINGIAHQYGVEASTLVRANGIPPPYKILVGQILIIPSPAAAALASAPPAYPDEIQRVESLPPPAVPPVGVSSAPIGGSPTAQPPATGAPGPAASSSGNVVAVPLPAPATASAAAPSAATSAPAPAIAARSPSRQDADEAAGGAGESPQPPETKAEGFAPAAGMPSAARSGASGSGLFLWPLRGKIVSGYGAKDGGLFNDGINIAAKRGESVVAAGDGVVVYAGNEIRGFGNLVLVKHAKGWMTAYAHNDRLLVRRGERVRRGQPIAKAGSSGGVASPQLHFEVRKGSRAVDPVKYLGALPT